MRKTLLSLIMLLSLSAMAQEYNYTPTKENLQAREEFQDNRLGIFIHWGIYSMMGHGEWVMNNERLKAEEYSHLAQGFYPSLFNAEEWVKTFRDAGAKYITITTRHHDGFSMFGTRQSSYNIVDATPFHRDVIKEISQACQKYGMKLHLYYSHLDWTRPDYPVGRTGKTSGRPTDKQDFQSYYQFMNSQIEELLTNYGPIGAMWFDGMWDHDYEYDTFDWQLGPQYQLIHHLQPSCLVLNNHHMVPFPGEDIQGFEQDLPGENTHGLSGQEITKFPLEACMTMNESWGYNINDKQYKSLDDIIRNLVKSAGKNCNLLLNVGPRPDGMLPAEAVERLKGLGQWMAENGETIYNTRGGEIGPHDWGVTTQKGNKLYVHILKLEDRGLYLPLDPKTIKSVVMYSDKSNVAYTKSGAGITLLFPETPKGVDTIVEISRK